MVEHSLLTKDFGLTYQTDQQRANPWQNIIHNKDGIHFVEESFTHKHVPCEACGAIFL